MTIDSIIFDMDGTLWDAVESYAKGWNNAFKMLNINQSVTKSFLDGLMGLEEKTYLEKVIPAIPEADRKAVFQEVIKQQLLVIENEGGTLFPGVRTGLEILSRHYQLFMVSNCPTDLIKYFIRWNGFENLITDYREHGHLHIPKYENINNLKQVHKLQHPVYVGDTDSDRKHSEMAGVPFIFVDYGFGQATSYHQKFSNFDDLTSYFLDQR